MPQSIPRIQVTLLDPNAVAPTRAHPEDAGLDLHAVNETVIGPGHGAMVSTGIALAVPKGHVGWIADRSSLGKKGVKTHGGIVDAGYRGEIKVILWNLSPEEITFRRGDRIAQMLIVPIQTPQVEIVSSLDSTDRGAGGFGSTGK